MIARAALVLGLLLLPVGGVDAGLPRAALQSVAASPPPGARLPLDLSARDTDGRLRSIGGILAGRPAFVNFIDYTCNTLCGTDLMLLTDAIRRAGLRPSDFRIIVIGIDPKDSAKSAITMKTNEIDANLRQAAVFLLPDKETIKRATTALGFHYVYDPAIDQFAHAAAVYAVAPDGAVRGVLSPLELTAGDMKAALVETTSPQHPSLIRSIHSLCYAYDPVTGLYNLRVAILLKIGAAVTLLILATSVLLLTIMRRRRQ
jgi:protein SCO1/2